MKLQQSEATGSKFPSLGLSACILGLVLCPLAYIAIGALTGFAPAFSFLSLPLLLASTGYLLYRYLSKPGQCSSKKWLITAEMVSWILIMVFLVIVSDFTLLTKFERIGLFCSLFLATSVISLPIVLMRQTALIERLKRLPNKVTLILLLVMVLAAAGTMALYLQRVPAFP